MSVVSARPAVEQVQALLSGALVELVSGSSTTEERDEQECARVRADSSALRVGSLLEGVL